MKKVIIFGTIGAMVIGAGAFLAVTRKDALEHNIRRLTEEVRELTETVKSKFKK